MVSPTPDTSAEATMPPLLRLTALALLAGGVAWPATAAAQSPASADCPWWRPCGSGNTFGGNRFVPQGWFGVDVRPSCAKHDQCYRDATGRRIDCDRAMWGDFRTACQDSPHPWLCHRMATAGYLSVRLFGRSSFGTH